MNITRTNIRPIAPRVACKPGDCGADQRKECRQEIRNMVIEADNHLVASTLYMAGRLVAGVATAGAVVGLLTGNANTGMTLAATVIGGAATFGLHHMKTSKDAQAIAKMGEAIAKVDETGCYTREELFEWYRGWAR